MKKKEIKQKTNELVSMKRAKSLSRKKSKLNSNKSKKKNKSKLVLVPKESLITKDINKKSHLPPLSDIKRREIKTIQKSNKKNNNENERLSKIKSPLRLKNREIPIKINANKNKFNSERLSMDNSKQINSNIYENKTNEIINSENNYNENEEENTNQNENIIQKEPNNIFSVFHFFKTDNIYFFIKNSKIDNLFTENPNLKSNKKYEILENFTLPQAYRPRISKYKGMPQCIINTCINGNISIIKNLENCNIIWKLFPPGKIRELIRTLGKNQKFNHFPSTYQIGRKDNMYKHYKYYKKILPDYYNFVPQTFILPQDIENFENELKKNKKNLWIVKPVNMSRGRGVHLLQGENEFKTLCKKSIDENEIPDLISKYLDKPHLINNKKYDLRIYVLVASFSPLRLYIYYNGLVRFATENYQKGNYDNVYIHLTNYSINKNNLNYKSNQKNNKDIEDLSEEENEEEDDSSKWSLVEYRIFFKKLGLNNIMENIWKQIIDIIIKSLMTVSNDNCKEMAGNKNNILFELYGFDMFVDENYRVWLLEVNVNPSLHCTSPLDLSIKTDLVTDIFNVVGIIPYNHNSGDVVYNYKMKNKKEKEKNNSDVKLPKIKQNKQNMFFSGNSNNNLGSYILSLKSTVLHSFDPLNLKNKIPEYDNDYYKKMLLIYNEEKERALTSGFTMIFPLKENIEYYSKILIKDNCVNDMNIVLWEYILNNE